MKYLTFGLLGMGVLVLAAFAVTWFVPYQLGYQGEVAVGFYRMQVVQYDVTDYGGRGTVTVIERLGGLDLLWGYLINGGPTQ